ncbi:hypothetical protein ABEW34_21505 [Paenibacillus algorifonticola]|uniref:hypothetical protein n=1 Tax=Paenibacillus algorifonticola TaxID=684063 RepID=UPI003D2C94CC
MTDRLISSQKLLSFLENSMEASSFWRGEGALSFFDELTDAIENGQLDPMIPNHISNGDTVILPNGTDAVIIQIQYIHNRYQLRGVSGWAYGIDQLKKE